MESDYKIKYMKYKKKYLDLKAMQKQGGGLFSSIKETVQSAKQQSIQAVREVGAVVKQDAKSAAQDIKQQSLIAAKDISRQAVNATKDITSQAINTATIRASNTIQSTKNTVLNNIPRQ